jgi:hypothetical protein
VKAQNDETTINSIFYDLFDPSLFKYDNDTLLINSTIYKTRFEYDSISFEKETGLKIPERIISEFRNNVEKNEIIGYWNENELNAKDTIFYETDTIIGKKPFVQCITDNEEKVLFERTKKRQRIYSISKLLFDNNHENAIFNLYYTPFPGDVSSHTIFIKKIYGKWVIILRFGYRMS